MRRRLVVHGIVQGVGFRPFVYRLAHELGLAGWVRNDGRGVTIEAEGLHSALDALERALREQAPPLARIDEVQAHEFPVGEAASTEPGSGARFAIVDSRADGPLATSIGPDAATCPDCLRELFDPADRRWRYAFINCTHCGPRFTITRALPYDRAMTSMASFVQCPACLAEYGTPSDRRFHAEPNACPACGPRLWLADASGRPIDGEDPVAGALARLRAGAIVALKGLGGFHLACDARQADAVAALRRRKGREQKPFAVMVAQVRTLQGLAAAGAAETALLEGVERPIVLLRKAPGADAALPGVAPGLAWLGAMLPGTPLHWLLFHEAAGRPAGTAWLEEPPSQVLVMTSANPSDEPLVVDNDEALQRLDGIADAYLMHDRGIVQRCDDSVLRSLPQPAGSQFVRRARGWSPRAIALAHGGPPLLALGGFFKNTACVVRGREAFLTPHVGDLDHASTCRALDDAVQHLLHILHVVPQRIAHDLHPDFYSTRLAARLAGEHGAPLVAVQHHHAHIAAVLAEHRVQQPALGLALDGVGIGTDGAAWGGELLRVEGARFDRLSHLAPVRLPGADRAAREPWRVAVALLRDAGRIGLARERFAGEPALAGVLAMLERGLNCPATSSLGRWFDAAAAVLGVQRHIAFEGQAAMLLEGLAEQAGEVTPEPALVAWHAGRPDLTPLVVALATELDAARGAARFHATLAHALADWVAAAARAEGLQIVACGGGCWLNAILSRRLARLLQARGLTMLQARLVPPNDGGLSLGQAWVASLHENPPGAI